MLTRFATRATVVADTHVLESKYVCELTGYVDTCKLDSCGGGGMLVCGEGSVAHVRKCEVFKNHQSGLEAREGGRLIASDNCFSIYNTSLIAVLK